MTIQPMLSASVDDVVQLEGKFPLYASPKLDGIRAIVVNGVLCSRNLKPIPNAFIQKSLPLKRMEGLDGELVVGAADDEECFRRTTSGVMSRDGEPKFKFFVFDNIPHGDVPFKDRLYGLKLNVSQLNDSRIQVVPQTKVFTTEDVTDYEHKMLEKGYEGIMLRKIDGSYKQGRSTLREGHLMKLKQFKDSEAVVLELVEQMENTNEKKLNEAGKMQRTSHKAGKIGKATLGAITVRDCVSGVTFDVGSGFDDAARDNYWNNPKQLVGKIIKYKYFPTGSKDKPRFPVFLGVRKD